MNKYINDTGEAGSDGRSSLQISPSSNGLMLTMTISEGIHVKKCIMMDIDEYSRRRLAKILLDDLEPLK